MIILRDGFSRVTTPPSAVAMGVFDGLHVGHQGVLALLKEIAAASSLTSTVVTFDPPPARVLAPDRAPRVLATLDQRLEGLEALGIDQVRVLSFTPALASESAADFVARVLVKELAARTVIVGDDFHFGHNRMGNVEVLRKLGRVKDFSVVAAPRFGDGERFSSTRVRRLLAAGDLEGARAMLGRYFVLRGVVAHGDQRGRALGFPTANLEVDEAQQLPPEGVYAGAAWVEGQWWPAAISLGRRPQFYDEGALLVEVYVLGFSGDLYEKHLDVAFGAKLRDQSVYGSPEELRDQIERDVTETQRFFEKISVEELQLLR